MPGVISRWGGGDGDYPAEGSVVWGIMTTRRVGRSDCSVGRYDSAGNWSAICIMFQQKYTEYG